MPRVLRSSNVDLPSVWNHTQNQAQVNSAITTTMTAPAKVAEIWTTNPFCGDFNPGTKQGHSIFVEKTKGLATADRLDLSKKYATDLHRYFRAREDIMGDCIRKVPSKYADDGTITESFNLMTQYQQLTIQDCQRAAFRRYNNHIANGIAIPTPPFSMSTIDPGNNDAHKSKFYSRVHSSVVAAIIKNGLSVTGYDDLLLQKEQFSFHNAATGEMEYDGPTMLFLIFEKVDPSTVVGLDSILKKIENAKLGDFSNNVDGMLTMIESNYKILKENKKAPDSYRRLLLEALVTGPNHHFNQFIDRITDDVESGIGAHANITPDNLIKASRTKFNNMEELEVWNKVDPRDAKILALTTIVAKLEKSGKTALATGVVPPPTDKDKKGQKARTPQQEEAHKHFKARTTDKDYISGIARWRIVKGGSTKTVDGILYHWCPHHVKPGLWDGMYQTHSEAEHRGEKFGTNKVVEKDKKAEGGSNSLQLQSRLKEVMCTNLQLSSADVEKLFEQASEN